MEIIIEKELGMLAFTAAPANFESDPNPFNNPWIKKENTSYYHEFTQQWESPTPKRHVLGLVGGNEVSKTAGNQQDIESDLKGITRPFTHSPKYEHQPVAENASKLKIVNRKTEMVIDIRPVNLEEYQMWGYAAAYKPLPLQKERCGAPSRF